MTSSVRGADGENLQNTETISGTLSESPKLTFAQDAGDDTVSRNEGTWDTDGRFAIGQKVTIGGTLVAWTTSCSFPAFDDPANLVSLEWIPRQRSHAKMFRG